MVSIDKYKKSFLTTSLGLTIILIITSFASAQEVIKYVSIETENGIISGSASTVDDVSASSGKHIRFDNPVISPPNPPSTDKIRRFPGDPNPKLYNKSYWGAGIEGGGDPSRHEDPTGKSLSIRRTFYSWTQAINMSSYMYRVVAEDVVNNRLPFVSIKPAGWKDMADGVYDTQIDAILRKLDSHGKPVWFVVHHEPEGGGGNNFPDDPGGAFEWRRMQVKIRQRMIAVGTKNIGFMPILMTYTWSPASNRTPSDWWVDGIWDAYCVDHYQESEKDHILKQNWFDFVSWIEAKGLPYCIGEWGNRGTDLQAGQEMRDFWNWTFNNKKDMIGYAYFDSGLNSPKGAWTLVGEQLNVFQDILKNDTRIQRVNDL
jgi:hypothetical protein